jgi:hypothetical protein
MGLNFNTMFPSRFVKAADLSAPIVVTIKKVVMEMLGGENSEERPILYFEHGKPLVLNKTNAEAIINLVQSEEADDWIDTEIELFASMVLFHGQRTPCVRVRKPSVKEEGGIPTSWSDEPGLLTMQPKKGKAA